MIQSILQKQTMSFSWQRHGMVSPNESNESLQLQFHVADKQAATEGGCSEGPVW